MALSSLQLFPQQSAALDRVRAWLATQPCAARNQVFRLFGYAGTGKTELARLIQDELFRRPQLVRIAAFTGKAASELASRGCKLPTTVHDLIYGLRDAMPGSLLEGVRPVADIPEEAKRKRQPGLDPSYDALGGVRGPVVPELIIIDEGSMIGEKMARDLLATGFPVIVMGDPAQLPPVSKTGGDDTGYFMRLPGPPEVLLTEIHRFARGNPIYELAERVRNHEWVKGGLYEGKDGRVRIVYAQKLTAEMVLGAEQVIVGKHVTRHTFNEFIRQARGYAGRDWLPLQGERLVCLKNEPAEVGRLRLLNGSLWTVLQNAAKGRGEINPQNHYVDLMLEPIGRRVGAVAVHVPARFFLHQNHTIDGTYSNFTWGYSLTCHKAQGSEWDKVLVIDEGWSFKEFNGPDYPWRWLYTAITRAKRDLTIVRRWRKHMAEGLA